MLHQSKFHRGGAATLVTCVVLALSKAALAATATDLSTRFTAVSFRNGGEGLYTVSITNKGLAATDDVVTLTLALPDQFYFISGGNSDFSCEAIDRSVVCTRTSPIPSRTTTSLQIRVGVCSPLRRVLTAATVSYSVDTKLLNNVYQRGTSVRAGICNGSPTATQTMTETPTPSLTPGSPLPTATPTIANTSTPANTATVTPTPSITATPSPTHTPIPAGTDLTLGKTSLGAAQVGQSYTYSLSVSNVGSAATNIPFTVVDTLPAGLSYQSAAGSNWSCSASGQIVTCTNSSVLAPGSLSNFSLTVTVGGAAYPTVTNSALLTYDGDVDNSNNTAHRPTTVRQ